MERSGIQGNPVVMATPVVWGHDPELKSQFGIMSPNDLLATNHLGCGRYPALGTV